MGDWLNRPIRTELRKDRPLTKRIATLALFLPLLAAAGSYLPLPEGPGPGQAVQPAHAQTAYEYEQIPVRVTAYEWTGSPMYDGNWPDAGAAACSWDLALGTKLQFPDGTVVICEDRGMLGSGNPESWVDVYGGDWAGCEAVMEAYQTQQAVVSVIRVGWTDPAEE